jgi:hypothetical protein
VPEFEAAYRAARREAFGQSIARLQQGTSAAATTLLKTMIDPNTPASVKVRAAEAIFNHAAKAIEIEDTEARVSELRRQEIRTSGKRSEIAIMISRNLTRILEYLESRFEPAWETRVMNIQFVNNNFEVVREIPMTMYVPAANDAGKRWPY